MKIQIPHPCHEDWNSMSIGLRSRHCSSCSKDVMDFTQMRREEIIEYLLTHSSNNTCGRIRKDQVDFGEEEIIVAVRQYVAQNPKTNRAFFVLALGALLAAGCQNNPTPQADTPSTQHISIPTDSSSFSDTISERIDTSTVESQTTASVAPLPVDSVEVIACGPEPEIGEVILGEVEMGDVIVEPTPPLPDSLLTDSARRLLPIVLFPEVQAEFKGGVDSLFQYINTQLVLPDSVVSNGIEGRLYVQFIIEFDGAVSHVEIVRDQIQNRELQENIEKMMLSMPKWKPAEYMGKPVNSRFVVPIRIR